MLHCRSGDVRLWQACGQRWGVIHLAAYPRGAERSWQQALPEAAAACPTPQAGAAERSRGFSERHVPRAFAACKPCKSATIPCGGRPGTWPRPPWVCRCKTAGRPDRTRLGRQLCYSLAADPCPWAAEPFQTVAVHIREAAERIPEVAEHIRVAAWRPFRHRLVGRRVRLCMGATAHHDEPSDIQRCARRRAARRNKGEQHPYRRRRGCQLLRPPEDTPAA